MEQKPFVAPGGDIEKKGWIGTAYASYGRFSIEETYSATNYESSISILTLGGLYGYQWVWGKVNVQTGAGLTFIQEQAQSILSLLLVKQDPLQTLLDPE